MDLSGNDKNKITGKKYQPVMSITGLNDQGLNSEDIAHNLYTDQRMKNLGPEDC